MSTLAHRLSLFMPRSVGDRLRPSWHRVELFLRFFRQGGRLRFDRDLGTWVASRTPPGAEAAGPLPVAVRSMREVRRWAQFGRDPRDGLYLWLCNLRDCETFWDIGSANGLEGFLANHLAGCKVVFVEPFTPSIETILKTIVVLGKARGATPNIEVVQAACDESAGYGRLITHTKPVPGETFNSVAGDLEEYCRGGRQDMPVGVSQWVKTVTLDELHFDCGLPLPTHLKVDVDGFELRVLDGGQRVFASRRMRAAAIEVNDDNGPKVVAFMNRHGYTQIGEHVHHRAPGAFTADFFFARDDLVDAGP